jgi:hypothetical protein
VSNVATWPNGPPASIISRITVAFVTLQ